MNGRGNGPDRGPDLAVEPRRPEASIGELLSELSSEVGELVRKELQLAKVEATEEIGRVRRAAMSGLVAGVAGLLALIMASLALSQLLDEVMDDALASAIVALLWIVVAGVLATVAKRHLDERRGLPDTTTTLKEDVQWIKAQRS
jgi:uncharacterized membrane protein YqjE